VLISKDYQQMLSSKGVPLDGLGIREVGLTRDDALQAIGFLESESIPILGGDVYFRRGSKIETAYANWYSDPVPGEDRSEFLGRSWKRAREYIKDFPERQGVDPLFVLVVGR
jgi:Immunity protein 40